MDDQLKEAWLKGDVISLELLLRSKNVLDCVGLFRYKPNILNWKYLIRPRVVKVFLEECVRQNIESTMLEQVGKLCYKIGDYGWSTECNILRASAFSITRDAQKQQRTNKDNCRKVITTLLGCCGKKRRAKAGILKDVGMIIAKNVWKTRRLDVWK
jgi:hypothetical protein